MRETTLTVPRLLMALVTLAGLTGGFFAWDFERAIGKLDQIDQTQQTMAVTVGTLGTRVDNVQARVDTISPELADHEKRISYFEFKQGKPQP